MSNLEIERKYLVREDFTPKTYYFNFFGIEQGYCYIDDITEIRIRHKWNNKGIAKYYYTVKIKETTDLSRMENEREINKDRYYWLLDNLVKDSHLISKVRYLIPLDNGLTAELDIYHEELDGLKTVEVEFPSIEAANSFTAPLWFGEEITEEESYKNKNLAFQYTKNKKLVKLP